MLVHELQASGQRCRFPKRAAAVAAPFLAAAWPAGAVDLVVCISGLGAPQGSVGCSHAVSVDSLEAP